MAGAQLRILRVEGIVKRSMMTPFDNFELRHVSLVEAGRLHRDVSVKGEDVGQVARKAVLEDAQASSREWVHWVEHFDRGGTE